MKKSVGSLIRAARERKDLERAELAKKLKISPAYLGHLENDNHVTLSPRVLEALLKAVGLRVPAALVERHNKMTAKWYREYHAARKQA